VAVEIIMPKVAMAMNEGTILRWAKEEGEQVARNELLFEIETEKVTYEQEAPRAGLLHILRPAGETVPTETVIAYLAKDASELADLQGKKGDGAADETPGAAAPSAAEAPAPGPAPAGRGRAKASPLARRVAAQGGVDLATVNGTGPGGRIKKRDIESYLAETAIAAANAPGAPVATPGGLVEKARVPMTGMRGRIARAMMRAMHEAAHTHLFGEIDVTETMRTRRRLVEKADLLGTRVSLNAFFLKAMAIAARRVPIANATVVGEEIVLWQNVNIGVAVAVDGETEWDSGLLVPVVRDVDRKGLVEIDLEIRRLTEAARSGALTSQDTRDGTMTLSSTAGFWPGWASSTPLLNLPQVMIVQPGSAVEKPVVADGEIVIRTMMPVAFTADHRALDGAPFGRFYAVLHECLRDPETMLA
jgi:pyruvate/2-oxoglutarate dehydrogenase complex dihydrolipoamide acyltransferase (E2) component